MTQEYKIDLLKYLTGNLKQEEGENVPLIQDIQDIQVNLEEYIKQYYPELGRFNIQFTLQRNNYIILACGDFGSGVISKWKKSFFVVLDRDYNPIKFIDRYASGTKFSSFFQCSQNTSGNIYCADVVLDEQGNPIHQRLLIINDFTLNNFEVRLLNSYIIPKYKNQEISIGEIIKNPNSGEYFMTFNIGYAGNSEGGVLEFVNNVGMENEWNFYTYNGTLDIEWLTLTGVPSWDDGLTFKAIASCRFADDIQMVLLKQNVVDETKEIIVEKRFKLPEECYNVGGASAIMDGVNFMVSTGPRDEGIQTNYVIKYDLETLTPNIVFSSAYEEPTNIYESDDITTFLINGQFSFINRHIKRNLITREYLENKIYYNQIFNNVRYEFYLKDLEQTSVNETIVHKNVYNLYDFGLIYHTFILTFKQVFNEVNYNGHKYTSKESLVPRSVNLYKKNDNIIFSRNLYNKIISGNTTESIVEVPNVYINDIPIVKQNLIGKTKQDLIINEDEIETNIYERLLINFYNTINMKNINDIDNEIPNLTGAIRVNYSVSEDADYEEAQMNKARINYADGTNEIVDIVFYTIENAMQTTFNVLVEKEIKNIELISNDEETIYNTITGNFIIGKTYTIKQNVTVDGVKIKVDDLYYNNEPILYNGQRVQVVKEG